MSIEDVIQFPARILESGPAAGVIGAAAAGVRWGHTNSLTVDMGGTTAKAALVEGGRPSKTNEYEVGAGINVSSRLVKGRGHALKLPVIDISEIGAGGGSMLDKRLQAVCDGAAELLREWLAEVTLAELAKTK